jgi:hypothetical protein
VKIARCDYLTQDSCVMRNDKEKRENVKVIVSKFLLENKLGKYDFLKPKNIGRSKLGGARWIAGGLM